MSAPKLAGQQRHVARWRRQAPLIGALTVLSIIALGCRSAADEITVRATTLPAISTASATRTPAPSETAAPGEVTTVKDLVARYGWPAGTEFARVRIPSINVDARVGARVVGADAVMALPYGPADVVWYDMSRWPGLSGTAGGGGNAVFSGHVDYADNVPYANVAYRGQGVFSQLRLLSVGDVVQVDYQGQTLRYRVVWRKQLRTADGTDWGSIWTANVPKESITLYTCGGAFDTLTREYTDRVVVRAEGI